MKIEVVELQRSFGRTKAVDGLSFSFTSGEVVAFVGPNGAGKTTTMRILATLDVPDGGDCLLDGTSVVEHPELARSALGFMPDALPAHRDLTVATYLDFFARAHGLRGVQRRSRLDGIVEFTGLGSFADKTLAQLSKGMKQRVSLARALVHDPQVLILDEPAAGLDPRARIELRELIQLLAEEGKSVLISSHILSELAELCTSCVIIERGCLVHAGTLAEVAEATSSHRTVELRCLDPVAENLEWILEHPSVIQARVAGKRLYIDLAGDDEVAANLLAELVEGGLRICEMRQLRADLEEVFLRATTGALQ